MVQFHLGENSISFSDDFDKLNALRGVIADGMSEFSIYDTMAQLISKHGRMPDVDEFASVFPLMINKLLYEVIVPEIVDFLVENEIYDCSEELFVRKYQQNSPNFKILLVTTQILQASTWKSALKRRTIVQIVLVGWAEALESKVQLKELHKLPF